MIINGNVDNFIKEVLNEPGQVLVDFWAPGCIPCKPVKPLLQKADRLGIKVVQIDAEEEYVLAERYDVMSLPTVILFENGSAIHLVSGSVAVKAYIESYFKDELEGKTGVKRL